MNSIFKQFYQEAYRKTGGYFSQIPNARNVYPGDFFQIRNGQMIILGNIFNPAIIDYEDVNFENEIPLNPSAWSFQRGCSKPYAGKGSGQNIIDGEFEYSKQILAFEERGSFLFKGNDPQAFRIANWSHFQDALIIKMTQTHYSFRELFIVTDCVALKDWTLAISGNKNGELEIATETENFGLTSIFGDPSNKTIQSKEIEFYQNETIQKSQFFKAKKLVVNNDKIDVFISNMISREDNHQKWARDFFEQPLGETNNTYASPIDHAVGQNVLDLLQGNQLNVNTALNYFQWVNAGLDDLEQLCEVDNAN
jgi:hypothetical protein